MTDSAIGGVPTSGTDAPGDGTRSTDDAPATPVSPGEVLDGEVVDGEVVDGEVVDGEVVDGEVVDGEVVDGGVVGGEADGDHDRLATELAERTADLQRVSAEYANYRRRVERDRDSTVAGAKAQVAGELLTVLDDVERAEAHGDLTGPFKVVADRLGDALGRAGLVAFGAEGDAFDPAVHEAVAQETSPDATGPTVSTVMRRGYRFGDRVLRPAMVAVVDADPTGPRASSTSGVADPPTA